MPDNGADLVGRREHDRGAVAIIPEPTIAGAPFSGPSSLEAVLKRRFRSQNSCVLPSAVLTRYVSPHNVTPSTLFSGSSFFRFGADLPPIIMPPICGPGARCSAAPDQGAAAFK
jgi:hypothetical protein